jgi:hypothetical protein
LRVLLSPRFFNGHEAMRLLKKKLKAIEPE